MDAIDLEKVKRLIEDDFPNANAERVASEFGYSVSAFGHRFSKQFGISLGKYILRVTLNQAYEVWVSEGARKLKKHDTYKGIKDFGQKFHITILMILVRQSW